jgi:beta-N-acetylhexosaminidase
MADLGINTVGKMFIVGLPGPELTAADEVFLREVSPAGVCLFARNIKEPLQVRALTDSIRGILGGSAIICIDQEGGRVDRLRRILEPMPTAEMLNDPQAAFRLGELSGRALRMLGILINFAPVVDVSRSISDGPLDNGLQTRMFSDDPSVVTAMAAGFLDGSSAAGVGCCLKHFPGLGASSVDSHETLPTVEVDEPEMQSRDLAPYRALVPQREVSVMVAHCLYPKSRFNSDFPDIPSSINPRVYRTLREVIGFQGLALTDDLEMGAIVESHGIAEASLAALEAGADIALICNDQDAARRAYELCAGRISESEKLNRILGFHASRSAASGIRGYEAVDIDTKEWEYLNSEIKILKEALTRS